MIFNTFGVDNAERINSTGIFSGHKKELNMAKMNCWEFHMCGREPGGDNVSEFGICPATTETSLDGSNLGRSGGRACWAISGTFCEGKVQGTFATKLNDCKKCGFFKLVLMQQGCKLQDTREIRRILILADLKCHVGKKHKDHLDLKIRPLKGRRENLPKANCWEFMECGREPGGEFVDELGVCPAAENPAFEGINQGNKGGRACWAVSGTLCLGRVQEGFRSKQCDCERCDFYQLVRLEQGKDFSNARKIRQQYILKDLELNTSKNHRENQEKVLKNYAGKPRPPEHG
jgi:hypothetical protein